MRKYFNIIVETVFAVLPVLLPVSVYAQLPEPASGHVVTPAYVPFPSLIPERRCDTARIVFIGDVMQHMPQIKAASEINGHPHGYDYSNYFRFFRETFEKADLAIANMEFTSGTKPYSGYPRFSAPEELPAEACKSGIGLFLMANNHILDKGGKGLGRTLQIYDSLHVRHIGAYASLRIEESEDPLIIVLNGIRIAFVNFTFGTNGIGIPHPYVVDLTDSTGLFKIIKRAVSKKADMIIALPHWGIEYKLSPSLWQQRVASMLFRKGVRVIIGSHPHVPEEGCVYMGSAASCERSVAVPPESLSGVPIDSAVFYSLGNFISNQSDPGYTRLGLMVELDVVKDNYTGAVYPLFPKWHYIWCFRKGELCADFTTVPVSEYMEGDCGHALPEAIRQMKVNVDFIKGKKLIKIK
ncbi:MAG: CapA family protein [Bacteroidales bacterium]|nr:CapA family protein [Bacteroidales bacterium]